MSVGCVHPWQHWWYTCDCALNIGYTCVIVVHCKMHCIVLYAPPLFMYCRGILRVIEPVDMRSIAIRVALPRHHLGSRARTQTKESMPSSCAHREGRLSSTSSIRAHKRESTGVRTWIATSRATHSTPHLAAAGSTTGGRCVAAADDACEGDALAQRAPVPAIVAASATTNVCSDAGSHRNPPPNPRQWPSVAEPLDATEQLSVPFGA